jgi:hypothetical protein
MVESHCTVTDFCLERQVLVREDRNKPINAGTDTENRNNSVNTGIDMETQVKAWKHGFRPWNPDT